MVQEKLSRYVFDNMSEMVLVFDNRGILCYGNKSAETLLEYENQLRGVHISEIFPNEFTESEDGFRTNIGFDSSISNEMMVYRANRTCFLVEAKFSEQKQDDEYICILKDISNVKYLEKRIKQVEQNAEDALKVKSEFVANVTHELRTPVNGILGNTRELMQRIEDEKCQRILDLMERGCNDMHALINNILDFSKLESGKFTLEKREFDFRKTIDYVKGNHIHKITEKIGTIINSKYFKLFMIFNFIGMLPFQIQVCLIVLSILSHY